MSFSTPSTGTKTLSMFSVCTRVNVYPADLRKKTSKKEKQKERKTKKKGGQGGAACETPFPAGDISTWT